MREYYNIDEMSLYTNYGSNKAIAALHKLMIIALFISAMRIFCARPSDSAVSNGSALYFDLLINERISKFQNKASMKRLS